jgi:glycosyltransferase involved in cell wall biosynthesis
MPSLDIGVFGARGIPSTYSGYETFLTVLLPELVRRGHRVTMYCRRGAVPDGTSYEGIRKVFLPAVNTKELSTLSHGAIAAIVARVRRHDVAFVVNPANALFCAFGRYTGQPVALNTDGQEWLRGKWGRIGRGAFRMAARSAGRCATALVSDSAAMASLYKRDFGASSTVIPYCWTELDAASGDSRLVLEGLGLEPGRYACIAGRLNPENNAVPVAEGYCRTELRWPLLVLGAANYDSPVQQALARLAERDDRIRLVGHVDDRTAYATVVRHAGVYLHAHSVGGINPSLVEAMGCGAFVLALDTPFNREALGTCGLYFTMGELETELARACSTDATAIASLRSGAEDRARTLFRLETVTDVHEQLFSELSRRSSFRSFSMATPWGGDGALV